MNRGQDTVYLQKFNVTSVSRYSHQYMSNIEAPYAEGKKVKTAYNSVLNTPIVFSIPIYLDMPATPAGTPELKLNPNNWIKSLKVSKVDKTVLNLTPSFTQKPNSKYDIQVDNKTDKVIIEASAVSTKAKVTGTGTKSLIVGMNKIVVTITAEDGSTATYTINIARNK